MVSRPVSGEPGSGTHFLPRSPLSSTYHAVLAKVQGLRNPRHTRTQCASQNFGDPTSWQGECKVRTCGGAAETVRPLEFREARCEAHTAVIWEQASPSMKQGQRGRCNCVREGPGGRETTRTGAGQNCGRTRNRKSADTGKPGSAHLRAARQVPSQGGAGSSQHCQAPRP